MAEVTQIVLEGPAKNALSTALLTSVRDQLRAAGPAPLLLRGSGDSFSAGLNLKEVASFDFDGMETFLRLLQDVVYALFSHPAPTVACVNGHAIAGGAILALACDHTIGTTHPGCRIGLNEVALGLTFPPRLLAMARHRLPPRAHNEVLLGAGLHGPQDALRLGLVDALAEDPLDAATRALSIRAAYPRGAYVAVKADLRAGIGQEDPDLEAAFLSRVLPVWTSDEIRNRIRAFLERKR